MRGLAHTAKMLLIFLLIAGGVFAQSQEEPGGIKVSQVDRERLWPEVEGSTGIVQIYSVMNQLSEAVPGIPPGVERIAIYHLQVDRREFSPGMARFIRSQIEDVFRQYSRRIVISTPGLKTTRILVTDSTFKMSNTLPDAEQLWAVGRKLGIDAFVQGSVTRSAEGDVLLSLKMIKQESAEIVWSGNFVAGPNQVQELRHKVELGVTGGFGLWKMERYQDDNATSNADLDMYHFYGEVSAGEAVLKNRRLYLSLAVGAGFYQPMPANPRDPLFEDLEFRISYSIGPEMTVVLSPKDDPADGYYLGLYAGGRFYFFHMFLGMQAGLKSRLTRHMGISAGLNYFPLNRNFESNLVSARDYTMEMGAMSYDVRIHYFF